MKLFLVNLHHTRLLIATLLTLFLHSSCTSDWFKTTGATVTARTLNVRQGKGTEYDVKFTINEGDTVEIISEYDDWYKIETDKGTGFVYAKYLNAIQPAEEDYSTILQKSLAIQNTENELDTLGSFAIHTPSSWNAEKNELDSVTNFYSFSNRQNAIYISEFRTDENFVKVKLISEWYANKICENNLSLFKRITYWFTKKRLNKLNLSKLTDEISNNLNLNNLVYDKTILNEYTVHICFKSGQNSMSLLTIENGGIGYFVLVNNKALKNTNVQDVIASFTPIRNDESWKDFSNKFTRITLATHVKHGKYIANLTEGVLAFFPLFIIYIFIPMLFKFIRDKIIIPIFSSLKQMPQSVMLLLAMLVMYTLLIIAYVWIGRLYHWLMLVTVIPIHFKIIMKKESKTVHTNDLIEELGQEELEYLTDNPDTLMDDIARTF